ncbi:MAG: RidA family protein [Thermodesulfovibrionales bacterium]|nr:RidA family protein [Thermodesulfovibrionales bacterium]
MFEQRIKTLGIILPEAIKPLGSYKPCIKVDNILLLSAILPLKDGSLMAQGKIGKDIDIHTAGECARQVVLNALSIIKDELGSLDLVKRCLRLCGYLAVTDTFYEHPKVLNYASNLIVDIFGDSGIHARSVVGCISLPMNSPLAIDFVFECLKD